MIARFTVNIFVKVFTDVLRIEPDIKRGVQPTIGKTESIIGFYRLPDEISTRAHGLVAIYGNMDHSKVTTASRSPATMPISSPARKMASGE
jgi:hypothetical protein